MGEDEMIGPDDAASLDMLAALVTPEVEPGERSDAFLVGVSKALQASADVDADLANILSQHLLTVTPHASAVVKAKAAIVELAAKRAAPPQEQTDG